MALNSILTALTGLVAVLALVLLAARTLRGLGIVPGSAVRGTVHQRRLALAETLALDPRRRLTLVRCDRQELLILTGGPQDLIMPLHNERASPRIVAGGEAP